MLTTRCPWGITTVLLCTLLLQNCQSNSLRATEEEGPASGSSSASGMRHLDSIVPQATLYLPLPPSYAPAVHVPPSRYPIAPAHKKAFTTVPSSRSLSPLVPSIFTTVGTPSTAPFTLQPAAIPRFSHAVQLRNTPSHSPAPVLTTSSGERVKFSQVDGPWCAAMPPSSGDSTSQVARLSSAETASALSSLFASASVSSPSTFADSKPVAWPTNSMDVPLMAFGATEWKHYFGEVGAAPPLPADIDSILNSPCPFWPGKPVKDTHLLVLIPATVGDVPFTLNRLGELVQHPKNGGHSTKYGFYGDSTKAQIGAQPPPRSYWLLMTRGVLPDSRYRMYRAQKGMVATYASRGYTLPSGLEVATAILMHHARTGERLFGDDPYTYTRCLEVDKDGDPFAVGSFVSSGLDVGCDYGFCSYERGVACCRKF